MLQVDGGAAEGKLGNGERGMLVVGNPQDQGMEIDCLC